MNAGDIVAYQGTRWKVLSRDRSFRVCTLSNWEGKRLDVTDDLDRRPGSGLTVVYRPATWPFVAVPMKPRLGRVVEVHYQERKLEPFEDWVPSGLFSIGGSLFLTPALGLRPGEILILIHEKGGRSRVTLSRSFGTARHKKRRARSPWKPKKPKTVYDRLMGKSPFEDE